MIGGNSVFQNQMVLLYWSIGMCVTTVSWLLQSKISTFVSKSHEEGGRKGERDIHKRVITSAIHLPRYGDKNHLTKKDFIRAVHVW